MSNTNNIDYRVLKSYIIKSCRAKKDTKNPIDFNIDIENLTSLCSNINLVPIKNEYSEEGHDKFKSARRVNIDDITFLGEYFEKSRLSWWNEDRFFTTVTFVNVSNIDERGQELIELIHKKQVDDPDNDKVENMSELFANYPCYNAVVASYRNDDPKRSGKPSYVIAIRANKVVIKSSDYQYNPEDMS